jgi:predicted RNase H-like HicB family nuclease
MNLLPDNEIVTEYDDDSQGYYVVWKPLTAVGMGRTELEALEDLRDAAHFGIETMVNSKLREIGADLFDKEVKNGEQSREKDRRNFGHR